MPRSSAVPRTLKLLRDAGYVVDVVERYCAFSGRRSDMFGFADLLAISDNDTVAVQVCGQDFSSHIKKLTTEREHEVIRWLRGPQRKLVLIGWRKMLKKRGGVQKIFVPRMMGFYVGPSGISTKECARGSIPELAALLKGCVS